MLRVKLVDSPIVFNFQISTRIREPLGDKKTSRDLNYLTVIRLYISLIVIVMLGFRNPYNEHWVTTIIYQSSLGKCISFLRLRSF